MKITTKNSEISIMSFSNYKDLITHIPNIFQKPQPFGLLILNRIKSDSKNYENLAELLIQQKLNFVAIKGVDAQKIENIFDHISVERYLKSENESDLELSTSMHNRENLEDVVNYFVLFEDHADSLIKKKAILIIANKKIADEIKSEIMVNLTSHPFVQIGTASSFKAMP